jgi:hypothetical protein
MNEDAREKCTSETQESRDHKEAIDKISSYSMNTPYSGTDDDEADELSLPAAVLSITGTDPIAITESHGE